MALDAPGGSEALPTVDVGEGGVAVDRRRPRPQPVRGAGAHRLDGDRRVGGGGAGDLRAYARTELPEMAADGRLDPLPSRTASLQGVPDTLVGLPERQVSGEIVYVAS
ncbi:hypothetical protein [Streptomyces ipomoeae]|uniref:hypothetical protein n=1 Tax=Streptomyces ipomoeae TaxID=103232 RepID=UPI0011473D3B|nr:hypothetical protein [Streptomyces ipomoeae]MDX2939339.1 hypothetical protein [Streptomyces ipomoeae]TQE18800.1 hypothetical protein SipoB123_32735 [Streptomyces ipomoeae]